MISVQALASANGKLKRRTVAGVLFSGEFEPLDGEPIALWSLIAWLSFGFPSPTPKRAGSAKRGTKNTDPGGYVQACAHFFLQINRCCKMRIPRFVSVKSWNSPRIGGTKRGTRLLGAHGPSV